MHVRKVEQIIETIPMLEGAGVHLKRGLSGRDAALFDPFLMFDDFTNTEAAAYREGFPWHPHRGIETVTYILKGKVEHQDSIGSKGIIGAGDVQWMTAGGGIIHQEMPIVSPDGIQGFQLWVNIPRTHKMMRPRYQEVAARDIPVITKEGAEVRVIAGTCAGATGPVKNMVVEVSYLDITCAPDASFLQQIPAEHTAFAYVFEGEIEIENTRVGAGHIARVGEGDAFSARAGGAGARFLLISGQPLKEPIAWYGPIVMNTQNEVIQALAEYQAGTFVQK